METCAAYRQCLEHELRLAGHRIDAERELGCRVGLIVNFNKQSLVAGLKRVVLNFPDGQAALWSICRRSPRSSALWK